MGWNNLSIMNDIARRRDTAESSKFSWVPSVEDIPFRNCAHQEIEWVIFEGYEEGITEAILIETPRGSWKLPVS